LNIPADLKNSSFALIVCVGEVYAGTDKIEWIDHFSDCQPHAGGNRGGHARLQNAFTGILSSVPRPAVMLFSRAGFDLNDAAFGQKDSCAAAAAPCPL
jgi:hypothetical protein